MVSRLFGGVLMFAVLFTAFLSVGCNQQSKNEEKKQAKNTDANKGDGKKETPKNDKDHGWWCNEHGVPEHICSLCNDEVATKLKKEGDWCKEHARAESQCFICNPARYKKFEDMYVAKYGKKPERPPESEFKR